MKRFSLAFLLCLSLVGCDNSTSAPKKKKQVSGKTPTTAKVKTTPTIVSEFESEEWRKKDSTAMEYIYLANAYESRGKYKQALVLYKHVCEMDHALPDVFMYTAFLYLNAGDKKTATTYLRKEIERDKYFIRKKHPRSDSFEISILQAFYYLGEEDSLNYYARKYGQNPNEKYQIIETEMLYAPRPKPKNAPGDIQESINF